MPPQGRGSYLKPPPEVKAPARVSRPPAFLTGLPSSPFAAAQHQATRRVETALSHAPKPSLPVIPRLPNPTPQQTHSALQMVASSQHRALGANPSAADIREYQQRIALDPRLREYRDTVAHYVRAAEGHLAAGEGRRAITGAQARSQTPAGAVRQVPRGAAVAVGRALMRGAPRGPEAKPGPAPGSLTIPFANIQLPTGEVAASVGHALSSLAPGLASATPETQFVKNALGDVKAIGTLPFVGGLAVGKAGVAAAGGNLRPAEQLASGVAHGFEQGALGQLVQGNLSGAEQAVREHPVFSGLEALGASGVAGRGAGAFARAAGSDAADAGVRGALARAGSRVRPPIALTGEAGLARQGLVHEREYSPDLIRKALQVASDRTRSPVLDEHGAPVRVAQRGRQVPVLAPRTAGEAQRLLAGRTNYEASTAQAVERGQREVARKEIVQAGARPSRRPGPVEVQPHRVTGALRPMRLPGRLTPVAVRTVAQHLVPLVSEGVIKTAGSFEHDVRARLGTIRAALKKPEDYTSTAELEQAKANARLLEGALHPQVLARKDGIVAEGIAAAKRLNAADVPLHEHHIYPRSQLERSQLTGYAVAHMGARHVTVEEHEALERAAAASGASRAQQLAVSGRHPGLALAHETAKAAHQASRGEVRAAQRELRDAEVARGRAVGEARRAARGRSESRLTASERRAREGGGSVVQATEARVRGARDRVAEARAQAKAHEENVRQTPLPTRQAAIRGPHGEFLSNDEIRAHAAAAGRDPATLAYLPHRLNPEDARSYHRQLRLGARPSGTGDELRTFSMFRRGGNTVSHSLLHDELTAKRTMAARAGQIDRMIRESGLRHPGYKVLRERASAGEKLSKGERKLVHAQGYMTEKEGVGLSEKLARDGRGEYVPVRAFSSKAPGADQLSRELAGATMDTSHLGLLNDRLVKGPAEAGARNVVLVPKGQVDQLLRHLHPAGELERFAQLMNLPFRMAVLPQPRWLTGNFLEPYVIRLPLSGSGINLPGLGMDLVAANKVVKRLEAGTAAEKRAAQQIRQMHFQGLFIGRKGASVRRTYEDFRGGTRLALHAGHVLFKEVPVVKELGQMVLTLPHAFFHLNRVIESTAQRAAFGKSVRRDVQQFTGKWHETVLLGQRAIDDVSKGLVNTSAQHRFMRAQHELLGQYDGFSPALRRSVQSVTPFLPWTLASLRFVYWTLPGHHTVAFDTLLKAGQSIQGEWEAAHADLPPGTLRAALPAKDGGYVDVGRYTPYGVTQPLGELGDKGVSAASATEGLTGTFLPQINGALEALHGRDPFGRELQVPGGKPSSGQTLGIAVNQLAEGLLPLLSIGRRLREGGGTGYSNSTIFSPKVKPGTTHQSALNRTLNPFRETYLKAPSGGALSGGDPVASGLIREAEQQADQRQSDPVAQELVREAEREADRAAR